MSTLLIDSSFYAKRALHAFPEVDPNRGDIYKSMIRGFFSTVFSTYFKLKPSRIIFCFDGRSKYRYGLLPSYKGNRVHDPIWDLNISIIRSICTTLGFEQYRHEDYEADDLLGALALSIPGLINIGTADKDMAQLVNHRINCYNPTTDVLLDHAGVVKKFGVRPDQIIDFLALVSDNVDNIKGCPGIGKVTAASLLSKYQTVDNIEVENLPIRIQADFTNFRHDGHYGLSKKLITLITDVPINIRETKMTLDYEPFRQAYIPKIWDVKPDFLNRLEPLVSESTKNGGLAALCDF